LPYQENTVLKKSVEKIQIHSQKKQKKIKKRSKNKSKKIAKKSNRMIMTKKKIMNEKSNQF